MAGPKAPHNKSRAGCKVCKERRIKCDQGQPNCQNCQTFGVTCGGSATALIRTAERWRFCVSYGTLPHGDRGRPRTKWPDRTLTATQHPSPYRETLISNEVLTESTVETNVSILRHLEWTGGTAVAYSRAEIARQNPGPVLNMSQPYIIDFVRSVVASHLAYLAPHLSDYYRIMAEDFRLAGIRKFVILLPAVSASNGEAVLAAAVLICVTTLAQRPKAGEYLLFNTEGVSSWFQLLKGVRAVLTTVGASQVFSVNLKRIACPGAHIIRPGAAMFRYPDLPDWLDRFAKLKNLVTGSGGRHHGLCLEALESLQPFFEAVWGRSDRVYSSEASNLLPFIWIYRQKDDFIQLLEQKQSIPLVIFAHFSVLLKTMEHIWFVSGWSLHILLGIQSAIDPAYVPWLQWPLRVSQDPCWLQSVHFTRGEEVCNA